MPHEPLETYLEGVDPRAKPLVIALDKAIRKARPDFDVAIKYGLLMYALHSDWRIWVCSIGAGPNGVALRFLYGVLLDDPRRVLRSGSSVLKTWDIALDDKVEATAVGAYVLEAVARYDEYKASAPEILKASRAAAKGHGRKST
ncbi:MAG TPA: DUF1801 domain-containing protein [Candidatus Micrarchaeaceae archaeon]|nr:DUF1801 domain-containing protein [Candidatus Micrarchaeaceae archaeon]